MSVISRLADNCPDWVEVGTQTSSKLVFCANPRSRSGTPGKQTYELVAIFQNGELTVSESAPGANLPTLCVERHINPGSTFCLFMHSGTPPQSHEEALYWWRALKAYLQHQQYAGKHGHWPIDAQMSHGRAADIQQQMEALSNKVGWRDEILASIFRKKGWLGGTLPRLAKGRKTLVNVRSPCPRGCTRKHHPLRKKACQRRDCLPTCMKQHPLILRADCPHRKDIEQLVIWELTRRDIEARMIEQLKSDGHRCCGTMKQCALRDIYP